MADKAKVVEQPKKLLVKDFQLDEQFAYARSCVTLPVGWEFDEVLKPEFWANVANLFQKNPMTGDKEKSGAIIAIRAADHSFCGEVYVRAVRERDLIVGVYKEPVYFGIRALPANLGYETRWNVGKRKFDIIRNSDREIVGEAETKELAMDWIGKMTGQAKAA